MLTVIGLVLRSYGFVDVWEIYGVADNPIASCLMRLMNLNDHGTPANGDRYKLRRKMAHPP